MRNCYNCNQKNRDGAFYCKNCGCALVCPRCRLIQGELANFCDNCGQPLAQDNLFATVSPTHANERLQLGQDSSLRGSTTDGALKENKSAGLDQFVPQELLAKLQAARASGTMTGERRTVTILFCDVTGSTSAAENLDPEEWTEIINGAFEHMIRPVYHYEGTLARLMGDAILAFFGAPIAHEDDARRAVLAGLDIVSGMAPYRNMVKSKWGVDFDVRVGINTGEVVVGTVGSDLRMEYTAMGDAVNLASRMEQSAKPGTVQIAQDTYKLIVPYFDFEALGSLEIRGKQEPIDTYRVLGPKTSSSRARRLQSHKQPLVGRDVAQNRLTEAMNRVMNGFGQIVVLLGDMGLGKSRLIDDSQQKWYSTYQPSTMVDDGDKPLHSQQMSGKSTGELGDVFDQSRWFETYSLSYQATNPYSLFRNFIRIACGAQPGDPSDLLNQKLEDFIAVAAPTETQDQSSKVLKTLFGLNHNGSTPLQGESFKHELFETITMLVATWAADEPGVIVCEDIQWSDPASIDLLEHLFELSNRLPILFICTMRPDRNSPGWQVKTVADHDYPHLYTEIRLASLSLEESRVLVSSLLENDQLPERFCEEIYSKTAGNPFYTEEIVREMMNNRSVIPVQAGPGWRPAPDYDQIRTTIPDTLQSMLAARIDRLDDQQRHTLQMAAVIGPSFQFQILMQVMNSLDDSATMNEADLLGHLGELQRRKMIVQVARQPELTYAFRQTLVHESAYRTILHRQRRLYHLKVGEAFESLFPGQSEENAILLAHHFAEAEDHERSLKYNIQAADAAYRLYANSVAVTHYSRALTAAEHIDVDVTRLIHIYERRGRALELDSRLHEAVGNYEAMLQESRELESREMELVALMSLFTLYATPSSIFDFEHGTKLSDKALTIAQELEDKPAEAKILWNLLNLNRSAGRTLEALEYGERSLEISRALDLRELMAYCLNDISHMYNRLGQYQKSVTALDEAISLWRSLDNLPMLANSLSTTCQVHLVTGQYDKAISFSQEAAQISRSIDNIWGISYSQGVIGPVYWHRGEVDKALQAMEESVDLAEKSKFIIAQVYVGSVLAMFYTELGDLDRGLAKAQEAMDLANESPPKLTGPPAAERLARVHIRLGNLDKAAELVQQIFDSDQPVDLNQPDLPAMAECELAFYEGDLTKARRRLEERISSLENYGMVSNIPETGQLLAQVYMASNEKNKAEKVVQQSLEISRSLKASWLTWQLLALLANLVPKEQAASCREEAREIVATIAENISDSNLRTIMLDRARIVKAQV